MNITPKELIQNNFTLLDRLEHNDLVPFVQNYIKKWTKFSVFYYLSNLIIFALVGYYFVKDFELESYSFSNRLSHFSYGIALAFSFLPLHEFIHVIAYRTQGAKNTSYAANLKKFYFMALADQFVANKKEFQVVALAPFLVISGVLSLCILFVDSDWNMTFVGALLTHTAMCAGDFGLLSYFDFHKDKEVVTYDDVESKISYFYGRSAVNDSSAL